MEIDIRTAKEGDYPQVERIMEQVQALHAEWRPDINQTADVVLPGDRYIDHMRRGEVLAAAGKSLWTSWAKCYIIKMNHLK